MLTSIFSNPLITAIRDDPASTALPLESLETKGAALFSIAADQARKMQEHGQHGQGGGGGCRSIVALYQVGGHHTRQSPPRCSLPFPSNPQQPPDPPPPQGFTLVHINLAPLVLTFAAREPPPLSASAVSTEGAGGGPGALGLLRPPTNVGMILDSQLVYEAALAPLRLAVERQEREANSLRAL